MRVFWPLSETQYNLRFDVCTFVVRDGYDLVLVGPENSNFKDFFNSQLLLNNLTFSRIRNLIDNYTEELIEQKVITCEGNLVSKKIYEDTMQNLEDLSGRYVYLQFPDNDATDYLPPEDSK